MTIKNNCYQLLTSVGVALFVFGVTGYAIRDQRLPYSASPYRWNYTDRTISSVGALCLSYGLIQLLQRKKNVDGK